VGKRRTPGERRARALGSRGRCRRRRSRVR
jgi:hypothetical protein